MSQKLPYTVAVSEIAVAWASARDAYITCLYVQDGDRAIELLGLNGVETYSLDEKGNPANRATQEFMRAVDAEFGVVTAEAHAIKTWAWKNSPDEIRGREAAQRAHSQANDMNF